MLGSDVDVGAYRLGEPLGQGGMGVVYRATHCETGHQVALKTVRVPEPGVLQRLRREIFGLSRLRHPGVVRILDEGVIDGLPWYAMTLVSGRTLLRHWRETTSSIDPGTTLGNSTASGSLPALPGGATVSGSDSWWTSALDAGDETAADSLRGPPSEIVPAAQGRLVTALELVRRLCIPLAYLHGEGIVHRDLKPGNILVDSSGCPIVVDFGLISRHGGRSSREVLQLSGEIVGSAPFMAPEQIRGELVDARADLYALGCILYQLVTGRWPFLGLPSAILQQHLHFPPPRPSQLVEGVPEPLEALILCLLDKEPRKRLGYATDVAAALEQVQSSLTRAVAGGEVYPGAPAPRSYLYRPGFGGRHVELQTLRDELERLETGVGSLVFVGGESGIGKTRLVLELTRMAARRRRTVLFGECLPSSGSLAALRPILRFVADRCREKGEEETEKLLGQRGRLLASYEPSLRGLPGQDRYPDLPPLPIRDARIRLFSYLRETLRAISDDQGLVIILDDLQWADELLMGFLSSLAHGRELERLPVLFSATFRVEEASAELRSLVDQIGSTTISLERLDEGSVGGMIEDMLALPACPSGLVEFVADNSEGNPFFVAEYLRTAVEQSLLCRDERGQWTLAVDDGASARELYSQVPLPGSIQELVGQRLSRLSPGAQKLVGAASVLGREVDGELLAEVAGMVPTDVMSGTLELVRQSVLEPMEGEWFRFVHDKLREVAYEQLSESRRREVHLAAARGLEARGDREGRDVTEGLGRHWELGGRNDRARICYLVEARAARRRYALEDADRGYRGFLRVMEREDEQSIQVRNELAGDVLQVQGRMDDARALYQESLELGRRLSSLPREGETLGQLALLDKDQGRYQIAGEQYQQAIRIHRQTGDRARESEVLGNLGALYWNLGQSTEALEHCQRAVSIARELGDVALEASKLMDLGLIHSEQGQISRPLEIYQRALELLRQVGDRRKEGIVLGNLGTFYSRLGRQDEALQAVKEAISIAREIGNPRHEGHGLGNLGTLLWRAGRLDEVAPAFQRALELARSLGEPAAEGIWLVNLGILYRDQGEFEQAREAYQQALKVHQTLDSQRGAGFVWMNLADLERMEGGDLKQAAQLLTQAEAALVEVGEELETIRASCLRGVLNLAQVQSARGDLERARQLARSLGVGAESELDLLIGQLERAQLAFEAGHTAELFRGQLIADYTAGQRQRFVDSGHLDGSRIVY